MTRPASANIPNTLAREVTWLGLFQESSSKGKFNTRLTIDVVNAPRFNAVKFHPRSEAEVSGLLSEMAKICPKEDGSKRAGTLAITGENGIGKTVLVSSLVNDPQYHLFFIDECNIRMVIWFNCFEWRDAAAFDDNDVKVELRMELVKTISTALNKRKRHSLKEALEQLEKSEKFPLFIFDDVYHFELVQFLRQELKFLPICVISRENICTAMQMSTDWIKLVSTTFTLRRFNTSELVEMMKNTLGLQNHVPSWEIREMAEQCEGIPRKATEMAKARLIRSQQSELAPKTAKARHYLDVAMVTDVFSHRTNFASNKITGNELLSMSVVRPELVLVNAPCFFKHFRRKIEEEIFVQTFRSACCNPDNCCLLLVSGQPGVGKTTLVSRVVHDSMSLRHIHSCGALNVIVWLNCFRWHQGIQASDHEYLDEIVNLLQMAYRRVDANKNPPQGTTIDEILEEFNNIHQRVLIVLDDVAHASLIEILGRQSQFVVCCAITNDVTLQLGPNSVFRAANKACLTVGGLSNSQGCEMLETTFHLKDKLTNVQLGMLSGFAKGLPILLTLLGGQFEHCQNNHEACYKTISTLMGPKVVKRQRMCVEEIVERLFRLNKYSKRLWQKFYSVLLFDPCEPIKVSDFQILWNCKMADDAEEICDTFKEAGLYRYSKENNFTENCYQVHQLIYDAAMNRAISFYKNALLGTLSRLRIEVAIELQQQRDSENRLERFLQFCNKLLAQERRQLIERLFQNVNQADFRQFSGEKLETIDKVQTDEDGWTLLMLTAKFNQFELLKLIFEAMSAEGVKMQERRYGRTALMLAVEQDNREIVTYLVDRCPDLIPMQDHDSSTALMIAVELGSLEIVQLLATRSMDCVKLQNSEGNTALMLAARCCNVEALKLLASMYPDFIVIYNGTGETALLIAVEHCPVEALECLVGMWPDVIKQRDFAGTSALHVAAEKNAVASFKFLYEKYPEAASLRDSRNDFTPLMTAVVRRHSEIVTFMIKTAPAVGEIQSRASGETALFLAVNSCQVSFVELFCEKCPASAKLRNNDGKTALLAAVEHGNSDMVASLFDVYPDGAKLWDSDGRNAIKVANILGNQSIIDILSGKKKLSEPFVTTMDASVGEQSINDTS